MAPELYRNMGVPAQKASPQTDVYALATLCWEVLVGERPWKKYGDDAVARLNDVRNGANLDFARLPGDVPAELRALLERGVALDCAARPSARKLRDGLRKAREALESGRFDVFLSHAWDGNEHAPATTFLLGALRREGRRVWVDKEQMRRAMGVSMRAGVAATAVFVALVSRKYAASAPCMLELRAARDGGKTIIACLVEPDEKWMLPASAATDEERELARAVNTAEFMFADLREACAAGGAWLEPLHLKLLELLRAPKAAPRLLQLVADELVAPGAAPAVRGGAGADAGAAGGAGMGVDVAAAATPADEARAKGELLAEACRDGRGVDAQWFVARAARRPSPRRAAGASRPSRQGS
jgi:hypothetical protein